MRLNFNFVQSFTTVASLFLIAIPLVTFLRYYSNPEIIKVLILLFVNLISIVFFYNLPKVKISGEIRDLEFSPFRLSIFSLFCLLPLLLFVGTSIQGYSLLELVIFSEQYRQGVFSGSGIYTVWATQILPLIIFVIIVNNGSSKSLIAPILVIILASLILGLRVFLWGLFVGYSFVLLKNLRARNIIFGILFVLLFLSYKYFLNPEGDSAPLDLLINQLTRPDLHAIVKYEVFSDNVVDVFEYLPFLRYLFGHDITAFKDFYVPSIPNLGALMPYISLNSGVALPGHVIFYNTFFIMALIPCVIILLILYNLLVLIRKTKKIFAKFLCAYLFQVLSLMFFEDVNALYKIELEIVFVLLSYISYVLMLRKVRT